jgi:hypothetical protein
MRVIKSKSGSNSTPVIRVKAAASTTIVEGDLVTIAGAKAVAASTNIAGVAVAPITTTGTVGANDYILVQPLGNVIVRVPYIGTTKTTLTDADIAAATAFDLGAGMTLNLDDTTGGFMKVVAYDNTAKTADVIFTAANLAL